MMFAVITKVSDDCGNHANAIGLMYDPTGHGWIDGGLVPAVSVLPIEHMMNLYYPVFYSGEIIVVDELGREIGGMGRKPSKWFVEYEVFGDVGDAIKCSLEGSET